MLKIFFKIFLVLIIILICISLEQKIVPKETLNLQSTQIVELNKQLKKYGLIQIDESMVNTKQDLNTIAKNKKAELDKFKKDVNQKYLEYRDLKIKEYSYIPQTLLDIDTYLPLSPDINTILNPQSFFNYDIAKKAIDSINLSNPNKVELNEEVALHPNRESIELGTPGYC